MASDRAANYRIAVLPGDGIGPEVIVEARETLELAARLGGFGVELETFEAGGAHYLATGAPMAPDVTERLARFGAILAGPFGDPRVPDSLILWGTILELRKRFDQYVNLRPVRTLAGVPGALRSLDSRPLDIVVVRENTEGEYSGAGGRVHRGREAEVAVEVAIFTRAGTERVIRYAFSYARARGRRRVTSATKSNALRHAMPFWDEVMDEVCAQYPEIEHESVLVDALAARVVSDPATLDVVVASNLFGDVLSDLTAAAAGSLGTAPSANIDPSKSHPSLFQAVHGSAPDIAGRGIANPVGEILSVGLMLEFLGEGDCAAAIERAVNASTANPQTRTPDLGGSASTRVAGQAIREALERELSQIEVA
ncbi:MAG TPA: isocitrate/isopropylmalate dehydrogenase family protein [Solirubrobacteraceae bacterium]